MSRSGLNPPTTALPNQVAAQTPDDDVLRYRASDISCRLMAVLVQLNAIHDRLFVGETRQPDVALPPQPLPSGLEPLEVYIRTALCALSSVENIIQKIHDKL